ncbi:hypothetical protein, partial [Amycolatopsis sp. SID8362]|uniref:hypothetical protein n=1 Tax=Amycolatopsis sp. SID8362 TaxID=2690346 RepID=UPI00142AF949
MGEGDSTPRPTGFEAANMKNSHDRRRAKLGSAALSFGGWGDYEVWAAHGFTPKPNSDPAQAPKDDEEGAGKAAGDATRTSDGDSGGGARAGRRRTGEGDGTNRTGAREAALAAGNASRARPGQTTGNRDTTHPASKTSPTAEPRPGKPADPAADDRTRGRRSATLGTRTEDTTRDRP